MLSWADEMLAWTEERPSAGIESLRDRLGVRATNALLRGGYLMVAEVRRASDEALIALPNFGVKSLSLVRQVTGPGPNATLNAAALAERKYHDRSASKAELHRLCSLADVEALRAVADQHREEYADAFRAALRRHGIRDAHGNRRDKGSG